MRPGKLGDELAVQKAAREHTSGECEAARAAPETRRQTFESCADDEPADVHPLCDPKSDETA